MAAPRRPNPDRVVDAALGLAADRPWREISLADIAGAAGIRLDQLHALFRSKDAILDAFTARIDAQVIRGTDEEAAAEPVRDRLFDVLARRFEALRPHRTALASILCDALAVPRSGFAGGAAPAALDDLVARDRRRQRGRAARRDAGPGSRRGLHVESVRLPARRFGRPRQDHGASRPQSRPRRPPDGPAQREKGLSRQVPHPVVVGLGRP